METGSFNAPASALNASALNAPSVADSASVAPSVLVPWHATSAASKSTTRQCGNAAKGELLLSGSQTSARHEEYQYIDMVKDIIESGEIRDDRTGTGTISKFGIQTRWSLKDDKFPLLTTKRVFWKAVVEELLFFIKGDTNALHLKEKGVNIWEGNSSREYLDRVGLGHREVGDLGPVYGFQWRHFGATYENMHTDYSGKGVDQLQQVIELIKKDPYSRRIVMSSWNPCDVDDMVLPPCHMFCQFYVSKGDYLSCQMYQRSGDMGLGVPFNIASYSLLTILIAQVTGLKPKELIHIIGDAHVYQNHVSALKEQITRVPNSFPCLKINPKIDKIEDFKFEDIELVGYSPHPSISMKMAI
jgi:dihydrofolate reductase/thymidylate synthase